MRKRKLEELGRKSLEEFRQAEKTPIVVILDNIRSGMNVGSFFRTCDAFSVRKLYLCGITAQPPHREIHKTAIGADRSVDWEYVPDITTLLPLLRDEGYLIAGIEQTDESVFLNAFRPDPGTSYALIFGNEVEGLSEQILPLLDMSLEIPQFGTKHSLNVAVSGGIVLWHFLPNKI